MTVYTLISTRGSIGPFFLEILRGRNVTVNSDWYTTILEGLLLQNSKYSGIVNSLTWFGQDGSTSYTWNQSIGIVRQTCAERLISRRDDIFWYPRRPDLTPFDFFIGIPQTKCGHRQFKKYWSVRRVYQKGNASNYSSVIEKSCYKSPLAFTGVPPPRMPPFRWFLKNKRQLLPSTLLVLIHLSVLFIF